MVEILKIFIQHRRRRRRRNFI